MVTRRSILCTAAGAVLARAAAPAAADRDPAGRTFQIIDRIREQNGAAPLAWSEPIAQCARQQSVRKVELRFPGHNDPARGGVAERLQTAGIDWARCGENIFMERRWDDPVNYALVFWWYSPGHQANLLNREYTSTGVGLAQAADKTWFVTQIFVTPSGRPRSPKG